MYDKDYFRIPIKVERPFHLVFQVQEYMVQAEMCISYTTNVHFQNTSVFI